MIAGGGLDQDLSDPLSGPGSLGRTGGCFTLAMLQSWVTPAIAGVPVLVRLYSILLALIAYALFGSSPRLVVGPVSTVSSLSGSLVADLSGGDPDRAVAMTSALALSAGVGLIIGGAEARLGRRSSCPRPIVTGFVFGLVLLIILGRSQPAGHATRQGDVIARAWSFHFFGEMPR